MFTCPYFDTSLRIIPHTQQKGFVIQKFYFNWRKMKCLVMTAILYKISECFFSAFSKVCFKNSNIWDSNMCLCRKGLYGHKNFTNTQ